MHFPCKQASQQTLHDWQCYLCLLVTDTKIKLKIYCSVNLLKVIQQAKQFLIPSIPMRQNIIPTGKSVLMFVWMEPEEWWKKWQVWWPVSKFGTVLFEQALCSPSTSISAENNASQPEKCA
jgi:hypothetical protein